jgi:ankyrin repeat protein
MPKRTLPVHPDLEQLKRLAKELLHSYRNGDAEAAAAFKEWHPRGVLPAEAKLTDAQLVVARSYSFASWPRLKTAVDLLLAIVAEDLGQIRDIVTRHPKVLHESARGTVSSWGPPMSFAANLGKLRAVELLAELGAKDLQFALNRAALQGQERTAEWLLRNGAALAPDAVIGPCETLSPEGLAFLLRNGAPLADEKGNKLAPVALLLQTYSRRPDGKHACLELCAQQGVELPDTPVMAFHRGRLDLLKEHLSRDPGLPARRFSHEDIYPRELGCDDRAIGHGLHGTPLDGTTLLHMCVDFDEPEIAAWLLENGADVDARALVDADGFGGHTPLFNTVVSNAYLCGRQKDAALAALLLRHGANPNARASIRKGIRFIDDESVHEYRDVTPIGYGRRFHERRWVSLPAMQAIEAAGGRE